jgi:biotin-(acetyl-CoA carboxylase) ligase
MNIVNKKEIIKCINVTFKLNNMDKEKMPNSNRRGKRTIAKEKLYKNILKNIRTIYPNFNIGISTSSRGDYKNNWKDPYRHWCFKSKNSIFDSSLTKNAK